MIWWFCFSHRLDVDAIIEKGKTEEGIWEENSKFCSGLIKFEMPTRHAIRGIK